MKRIIVALSFCLVSSGAAAEEKAGNYVSFNLADMNYSEAYQGNTIDMSCYMGMVTVGHNFGDFFSIETRVGTGITEADETIIDGNDLYPVTLVLDNLVGIYGHAFYQFRNGLKIYGVIGYTDMTATLDIGPLTFEESSGGASLGYGLSYLVANDISVTVDYMLYISESNYDISGFKFGIVKEF
jgi:hypothetical protein